MNSEHNFSRYLVQCRSIADTMNQHLKGRIKKNFLQRLLPCIVFLLLLLLQIRNPATANRFSASLLTCWTRTLYPLSNVPWTTTKNIGRSKTDHRYEPISTPIRSSLAGLPIFSRRPTYWKFSRTIFGYTIFLNLVTVILFALVTAPSNNVFKHPLSMYPTCTIFAYRMSTLSNTMKHVSN